MDILVRLIAAHTIDLNGLAGIGRGRCCCHSCLCCGGPCGLECCHCGSGCCHRGGDCGHLPGDRDIQVAGLLGIVIFYLEGIGLADSQLNIKGEVVSRTTVIIIGYPGATFVIQITLGVICIVAGGGEGVGVGSRRDKDIGCICAGFGNGDGVGTQTQSGCGQIHRDIQIAGLLGIVILYLKGVRFACGQQNIKGEVISRATIVIIGHLGAIFVIQVGLGIVRVVAGGGEGIDAGFLRNKDVGRKRTGLGNADGVRTLVQSGGSQSD